MKVVPAPKRRPVSRAERRVTFALKTLALIALAGFVAGVILDFLGRIGPVTVILIGALFFGYAIYPAVAMLSRFMPRLAAIALVYVGIAALVVLALVFVVPPIATELQTLIASSPQAVARATTFVQDPDNPIVRELPPQVRALVALLPGQILALVRDYGAGAASRTLSVLLSAFGLIATVIIVPVLTAYSLIDSNRLRTSAVALIPLGFRPKALAVIADIDRMLGAFIRGQILVALIVGVLVAIALLATHVQYALLLGALAGVLNLVPSIGSIIAFVPAVSLALVNDGWQHALLVAALFVLINQLEGNFISPRVVGDSVNLPPLVIIVAILIGAALGGIGGMFLAVPVAGVLRILAMHFLVAPAEAAKARGEGPTPSRSRSVAP